MATALTDGYQTAVTALVYKDAVLAQGLLDEAFTLFINDEPEAAKQVLRDLVSATVGFDVLGMEIGKSGKSIHRMLSPAGNPSTSTISEIFFALQQALGGMNRGTSLQVVPA